MLKRAVLEMLWPVTGRVFHVRGSRGTHYITLAARHQLTLDVAICVKLQ